jgi:hypothetical protein
MNVSGLLETVIAAHGGRARWQAVDRIEANLSSGGLAFALHMQAHALKDLRIAVKPHAREVVLHDYIHPSWRGEWAPEHVRLLDAEGTCVTERDRPRASFSRLDRLVRWDPLDMLYFAGYALWNYLGFPFILEAPGVHLLDCEATPRGSILRVRFEDGFPTHSASQAFHIDAGSTLWRHDYTADVIGSWAKAANHCLAAEQVDGLRFYTRRRVTPRLGTTALAGPTLVWIEIDTLRLIGGDGSAPADQS